MADVKITDVKTFFNALVKNRANSGILWGTNAMPSYALADWFGGTTAGMTAEPSEAELGAPGDVSAKKVRDGLYNCALLYSRIRLARVLVYMTGAGYVVDSTAMAHLAAQYQSVIVPPSLPGAQEETDLSYTALQAYVEKLWTQLNAQRNISVLLQNTVCHSSCHGSCHGSRNRR